MSSALGDRIAKIQSRTTEALLRELPDGFTVERSTSVPANHRTGLPYVVMGPAWNHPPESGVRGSFGSGRTPDEAIVRAVRFLAEEGAS
ncbi:MAG TPA: hypothetical protein VLH36_03660 [Steroidobacteraceae bacterium]|nr:hypothetical protein [Steroidobacteraceae bacterium]